MTPPSTTDILGIGFGPANLSLAIALADAARARGERPSMLFLERQAAFGWHRGMMLPGADMQISFVKDLVTLRDPTSPFSFINYLHEKGRLNAFLNLKTFNPSRVEYNDYLAWAAAHFAEHAAYGERVEAVEPETRDGRLVAIGVLARDSAGELRQRRCRHLVLAAGGEPVVPAPFAGLSDPRVIHSSGYLPGIAAALGDPRARTAPPRILVIGAGQSAVEVAVDAGSRYAEARIDLAIRGPALKPADDSPFVNEIFDPESVDLVHDAPEAMRADLLASYRATNYAVVDSDLIQSFYATLYEERVAGEARNRLLRNTVAEAVAAGPGGLRVTLRDRLAGTVETAEYDLIVLATGYARATLPALLDGLRPFLAGETVDRHYRLPLERADPRVTVHLQGFAEASHGLTETLLSILPVRAAAIARTILDAEAEARAANRPALRAS
ncbi:lysine N(6)-hydroxylase/L-ornithine N(5)-oxygenase family protein [Methylobacterium organophilum]|uniref:L-ornithine N(5)-monooxygenase n=1 Tax=Methylobacterium organophilum TaxID=410 RepID=A0ABQ4T8E1_METOR|nr:SidA/IucD/PvdA family monooxygenase [Methylobacterium organophilum]GJE27503.1 L-ornithine N(5)-monooxygenase [Methylobacterium organophilum]